MNDVVSIRPDRVESPPAAEQTAAAPVRNTRAPHGIDAAAASGRWFAALCALIAVMAALAALAAPWLRPRLDADARQWFGTDNVVSRLVAPEPARPTAATAASRFPAPVAAEFTQHVEATLQSRQAIDDQRILAMVASLDGMRDELARSAASQSTATDGLSRRADQLQSAATAAEARARAASVLALAIGLRRDIDAGVPIGRDSSALQSIGEYPAAVERALRQFSHLTAGVPTMRDLAEGFEPVQARLAAHTASWSLSRGWTRVQAVFGRNSEAPDDVLQEHLQALVADGRFSEAANVLQTSEWAPLGADWIAMIRARAAGVTAAQVILDYALQITEAAYPRTGGATSRKPSP